MEGLHEHFKELDPLQRMNNQLLSKVFALKIWFQNKFGDLKLHLRHQFSASQKQQKKFKNNVMDSSFRN
jgi:hypothetical protein